MCFSLIWPYPEWFVSGARVFFLPHFAELVYVRVQVDQKCQGLFVTTFKVFNIGRGGGGCLQPPLPAFSKRKSVEHPSWRGTDGMAQ